MYTVDIYSYILTAGTCFRVSMQKVHTFFVFYIHDIDVLAKDHVDRFVPIFGECETFESR